MLAKTLTRARHLANISAGLAFGFLLATSVGQKLAARVTLQISDVLGLANELDIRALMGVSYTPNRAAMVGPSGLLESVAGNLSDCVRVDGTGGPCDPPPTTQYGFVDAETPTGVVNGSNSSFLLSVVPNPSSSLHLYRNGLRMKIGIDYSLADRNVTFLAGATPQANDLLIADYRFVSP